jgi:UDP-N-acetylmuramoyl-tripeptide--D-alanyl-D-alanine ligase
MRLGIRAVLEACGGRLLNGVPDWAEIVITSVCTDSRKLGTNSPAARSGTAPPYRTGALFVPLIGDNFDGHDYIVRAMEAGAAAALTEKPDFSGPNQITFPLIFVPSTRKALMDLAAYYRRRHNVKVVAVTGSAGKTTAKEMIASILSQRYKTKKTMGNFNNDIGLPLSVFQLEPEDEALVLEMGMNHANEITALSKAGAPDIAVITHIGDAHIENFENREGILRAKLEITDGLREGGTVIVNGDDPLLTGPVAVEKTRPFNTLYPNRTNIINTEPLGLTATRCHFSINGRDIRFTLPLPGNHMVMNALLAAATGIEMGLAPEEITRGLEGLEMPGGRLSIMDINGMTVINDAYNANPASMKEAIRVLTREGADEAHPSPTETDAAVSPAKKPLSRRVCILGDMNELGHVSEARHRELGIFAAASGIDLLITVGTMARWVHDGYLSATDRVFSALYFPDVAAFLAQWRALLFPGDIILIKASRGMAFERIVDELQTGGLQ